MIRSPFRPASALSALRASASKARFLIPALLLGSSSAWAGAYGESGWYISGSGAYSSVEDATNSTSAGAGGSVDCLLELPGLGCVIPGAGGAGAVGTTSESLFDDGTSFSLAIGRQFRNGVRSDLSLDWLRNDVDAVRDAAGTRTDSDNELEATGLMLNLWYDFALSRTIMPYVGGGLGARRLELSGGGGSVDDTVFGYQLGAGLGWALSDRLALSLDYRYLDGDDPQFEADGATLDSEFQAQTIGVSARYLFIHHPPPDSDGDGVADRDDKCPSTPSGVKVDATGCPLDSDNDGVTDDKDQCPDTPSGTDVDGRGCPLDSDGDGVTDDKDQCPDTPSGTNVDGRGCPLDGDGDGVTDAQDECPDSPPGSQVLANGCEALELKGVQFETDSAQLRPEAIAILDEAVAGLQRSTDVAVEVQGHTDDVGPDAYNMQLSQRRADAVRDYLIDHGIAAERLTATGYGESDPKTPNVDDDSRAQNRRVVLKVRSD